jgi:hypothetical protein
MCVQNEPSQYKAEILKYTAMNTPETQLMKVNYLTENTLLLHQKNQPIDVFKEDIHCSLQAQY